MSYEEIKKLTFEVAQELSRKGPGWAQEGVALREIGDRLASRDLRRNLPLQQNVLHAWHDLFLEKKLAWGYDLENPGAPFFHVRSA
jgi:hypothetical protein